MEQSSVVHCVLRLFATKLQAESGTVDYPSLPWSVHQNLQLWHSDICRARDTGVGVGGWQEGIALGIAPPLLKMGWGGGEFSQTMIIWHGKWAVIFTWICYVHIVTRLSVTGLYCKGHTFFFFSILQDEGTTHLSCLTPLSHPITVWRSHVWDHTTLSSQSHGTWLLWPY